jgi:hypothetical protein
VRKTIRDTAEAYRQEGKKIFERIEEARRLPRAFARPAKMLNAE